MRVFCILIFLSALSRKPQRVRLKEFKHIMEKERRSEKTNTRVDFDPVTLRLGIVSSTNAPVGIIIVRAGPERYFLFHVCSEKHTLPVSKKKVVRLFFQISKLTGGG